MMEEIMGMKMMKDPLMISRSDFETYSAAETKQQATAMEMKNLSQKTPQTLLTQLNHNLRLNQKKYKRAGQNQQLQHKKVEEQK
jgi:hypothetical protein